MYILLSATCTRYRVIFYRIIRSIFFLDKHFYRQTQVPPSLQHQNIPFVLQIQYGVKNAPPNSVLGVVAGRLPAPLANFVGVICHTNSLGGRSLTNIAYATKAGDAKAPMSPVIKF